MDKAEGYWVTAGSIPPNGPGVPHEGPGRSPPRGRVFRRSRARSDGDDRVRGVVAPSGRQYLLTGPGGQRAVVVEVGGGLRDYAVGDQPVLDGYGEDELCSGGRGQILAPWPNRVGDGRYAWAGRDFQLPLTEVEHGNAIHGLVR